MKNIFDNFTGLYGLSKTLRFELKPIAQTKEYIGKGRVLESDKKKADDEAYKKQQKEQREARKKAGKLTPLDRIMEAKDNLVSNVSNKANSFKNSLAVHNSKASLKREEERENDLDIDSSNSLFSKYLWIS